MSERGSVLYTQCPECGTVFRVTATVLRAARGQVRCGVCDATFDAIAFLTEDVEPAEPVAHAPAGAASADAAATGYAAANHTLPADAHADSEAATQAASQYEPALDKIAARIARAAAADVAPIPTGGPVMRPGTGTAAVAETSPGVATPTDAVALPAEVAGASAESLFEADAFFEADASFEVESLFEPEPSAAAETSFEVELPVEAEAPAAAGTAPDAEAAAATTAATEPAASVNTTGGPGTIAAVLAAADDIPDSALEFNAAVEDWDRVFVTDQSAITLTPYDIDLSARHADALYGSDAGERADDPLARTDEYPALQLDAGSSAEAPASAAGEAHRGEAGVAAFDELAALRRQITGDSQRRPAEGLAKRAGRAARGRAGPQAATTRSRTARFALAASAVLLTLGLGAQVVHYWRDSLAGQPVIGAPLARLYERLGQPLEPRWTLAAYDVKQWGAASEARPGALRVRASVVNRAAYAQPYPLLRVTFEDRFGGRIARRDFKPAEYLPARAAPRQLLPAGARADADLSIVDPGTQAVGFELEVCLARHGIVTCGSDLKLAGGGP